MLKKLKSYLLLLSKKQPTVVNQSTTRPSAAALSSFTNDELEEIIAQTSLPQSRKKFAAKSY
jgi:hypothetical protein